MSKVKGIVSVTVRVEVEASSETAWNYVIDEIAAGGNASVQRGMAPTVEIAGGGQVNKRGEIGTYSVKSKNVAQQTQFKRRYKIGKKPTVSVKAKKNGRSTVKISTRGTGVDARDVAKRMGFRGVPLIDAEEGDY